MSNPKVKKPKATPLPLLVEDHPGAYSGFPFLTFIQFRTEHVLAVVDNVHDNQIQCYVLDYCGPEGIDEMKFIEVVDNWYKNDKDSYPLSIALSRANIETQFNKIHRTYHLEFITRIVGPLYVYPIDEIKITRRRRRKPIPSSIKVRRVVKLS